MAEVASAYVSLLPSAKGFGRNLDNQIGGDLDKSGQSAGKRWGAGFKKIAAAGLAVGALAGAALVRGSLDEAREAQKVGALTTAVIKSTGGAAKITASQVGDLAGAISKKAGIDDEAIQSGANLLLTFKNIRNESGKGNDIFNQATASMTDMAAGMAAASGGSVDFRSASTMLGKALNDPIKGLAAMGRVGIQFSESQKTAIKRMVESGNTMGAQKAILKELNDQFGGAAASQATAADKAGVAWGNLKEQIGTQLLPVADKIATWATTKLIPAMSSSAIWIDKNKAAIVLFAGAIGAGVLAAKAYTLTTTIMATVQAAQAVAAGTATVAQRGLNTAMKANLIGIVVTALVALVAGLVYAYKKSETFRKIVNGVWSAIKTGATGMWHGVRSALAFIVDKYLWAVGLLVKGAAKAFGWVPGLGPKLKAAAAKFDDFRDEVNNSLKGIKDKNVTINVGAAYTRDALKAMNKRANTEKRAKGGPVTGGRTYLVGENGPELFTSRQSGRIIPNHRLGSTASTSPEGGLRPIVVNDRSGDPVRTAHEVARMQAFAGSA